MSRIHVSGLGAVSSAGWGVPALMEAVATGRRPEVSLLERETAGGEVRATEVLRVPKPADRGVIPRSPRLRRASTVGKHAAAAAAEALGPERLAAAQAGGFRLGVISTLMNGCVNYSNRFFGEVLEDPSTASPILFPETVYNAPSSHLSAMTASTAPNDTLVGDGAEYFTGIDLAAEWLLRDDCDAVLVVAAEELDWLSAEAMGFYARALVPSEGAAAVLLEKDASGPVLLAVPDGVSYAGEADRCRALGRVVDGLADLVGPAGDTGILLSDGRTGVARFDRAEDEVFAGWAGPRVSLRTQLGESLGAAAGLQTVVAVESVRRGEVAKALVTSVGGNEGVGAALFGA